MQYFVFQKKGINPIVYILYNQLTVSCLRQRNQINLQGGLLADEQTLSKTTSVL